MRCTAMSRLGVAFTSACQSPEIRFTLNVGSDGSPKVARPSNVDWLPDDRVNSGRPTGASVAAPLPSHPMETIVRVSAPAPASAASRPDMFASLRWDSIREALGWRKPLTETMARTLLLADL